MNQKRIAKIISVSGSLFVGIAEGLHWYISTDSSISSMKISPGAFVWCTVMKSEIDRTFLQVDPTKNFASKEEWEAQESQYQ